MVKQVYIQELLGKELILGIGNTEPWPIEGIPPQPNPTLTTQKSVLGFIPVTSKYPVAELAAPQEGSILIGNNHFLPLSNSLGVLEANACETIVVEGKLDHSTLAGSSYRSVGLYEKTDELETLVSLLYIPPVSIQARATENLKLIMRF
jgi:hypothetical protein